MACAISGASIANHRAAEPPKSGYGATNLVSLRERQKFRHRRLLHARAIRAGSCPRLAPTSGREGGRRFGSRMLDNAGRATEDPFYKWLGNQITLVQTGCWGVFSEFHTVPLYSTFAGAGPSRKQQRVPFRHEISAVCAQRLRIASGRFPPYGRNLSRQRAEIRLERL